MKKIFAIFISMLFVASLSLAVVGCKKAEEPAPAETPKVEAPVAQPGAPGQHLGLHLAHRHLQLLQYRHLQNNCFKISSQDKLIGHSFFSECPIFLYQIGLNF